MPEQNDWTPEPISEDTFDNDAWDTTLERYVIDKPTMLRIIATYNACAGVPTKWLTSFETGWLKGLIEEHITDPKIEIGKVYRVHKVPRDDK